MPRALVLSSIFLVDSDKMDYKIIFLAFAFISAWDDFFLCKPSIHLIFSYILALGSGDSFSTKLFCCPLYKGNNVFLYTTNTLYRLYLLELIISYWNYIFTCLSSLADFEFLGRCPCFTYLFISISQHGIINICWINIFSKGSWLKVFH